MEVKWGWRCRWSFCSSEAWIPGFSDPCSCMYMVVRHKEEEASHWPGSRKGPSETENGTSRHWAFSLLDCCPNKAVAAGTPATSGPLKDPDQTQAHCLNQRILCTQRNKNRNQIRQNPVVMLLYTMRKSHYEHLASKTASVLDNRKKEVAVVGEPVLQANIHCLIVSETMWSRFTYKIAEPWRIEATFRGQKSQLESDLLIFPEPMVLAPLWSSSIQTRSQREREEGIALTSLSDHAT